MRSHSQLLQISQMQEKKSSDQVREKREHTENTQTYIQPSHCSEIRFERELKREEEQEGERVEDEARKGGRAKLKLFALTPIDTERSFEETVQPVSLPSHKGYAIYLEETKSIADWIDLQILINQKSLKGLDEGTLARLRDRGTAIFKTREEAEKILNALTKSLPTDSEQTTSSSCSSSSPAE